MGTLTSIIKPIATIAGFAKPFIGSAQRDSGYALAAQQAQQDAALKRQQNLLNYQSAETDRLQKLRRAIASQRARAGGQGIGDGQGSGEAVLQGINEASSIDQQQNKNNFDFANLGIGQNLNQQNNINLLQRQQLRQNTALGLLTDNF